MSVARQLFLLQLVVLVLVIGAGTALAIVDQRRDSDETTRRAVTAVATTLAMSDGTVEALRSARPERRFSSLRPSGSVPRPAPISSS